jgi:hypothetical protein
MRSAAALPVLALLVACSSDPSTSGPPRGFEPRAPRALAEGENVVPLDPVGASIEASVASVPGNTRRLAANVMKLRPGQRSRLQAYYSHDGGATWAASAEIPFVGSNGREYSGQGDAVMASDRAGRLYSALLMTKGQPTYNFSAVGVSRSDDGGATWGTPAVITEDAWGGGASPFNDKEWIAVDNSGGARDGTVYVVWQRMDQMQVGVNSKFLISRSTDQGRTWSAPRETSATEPGGAMMIDVGPEGEIHIGRWSQSRGGYIAQVSTDGGDTFSAPVLITRGAGVQPQQPPNRYFAYPRLHADRSFGAHRGNVYFVGTITVTAPDGSRVPAPAISRSADGGKSWSTLRAVALAGNGDALFPTGIVDDANGEVAVAWLDRRDDPTRRTGRIYAARSRDGGATFEPAQPFSPPLQADADWMGEYYAIAAAGDKYVATFSDAAGRLSAFTIDFEPVDAPTRRRRSVRQ